MCAFFVICFFCVFEFYWNSVFFASFQNDSFWRENSEKLDSDTTIVLVLFLSDFQGDLANFVFESKFPENLAFFLKFYSINDWNEMKYWMERKIDRNDVIFKWIFFTFFGVRKCWLLSQWVFAIFFVHNFPIYITFASGGTSSYEVEVQKKT